MVHRLVILLAVVVAGVLLAQSVAYACTTIIVGKNRTADHSVLIAHTEDDPQFVLHYNVYPSRPGGTYQTHNGASIAEPKKTVSYMGVSYYSSRLTTTVPGLCFGGVNAYQVSTYNNWCDPKEANPFTPGGLTWTEFNELALMRAKTARQAVQIMGSLTETHGIDGDATMYGIADAKEGWWINIAPGGQWVARRVPDNGAQMIANNFNIRVVDFTDKHHKNFMWSSNVVGYAQAKGWYDPTKDGPFNFREIYSLPATLTWEGHASTLTREEIVPQLLAAHKRITVSDLMSILRDHYVGTKYDKTGYPGFPHHTEMYTVCNNDTQTGSVTQLRNWMPNAIGAVVWQTMRAPCSSVFVPWYRGITEFPTPYTVGTKTDKMGSASWAFNDLANHLDANYNATIGTVQPAFAALEDRFLDQQRFVESVALKLWRHGHHCQALKWLTVVSGYDGMEAYNLAQSLLTQINPPATP